MANHDQHELQTRSVIVAVHACTRCDCAGHLCLSNAVTESVTPVAWCPRGAQAPFTCTAGFRGRLTPQPSGQAAFNMQRCNTGRRAPQFGGQRVRVRPAERGVLAREGLVGRRAGRAAPPLHRAQHPQHVPLHLRQPSNIRLWETACAFGTRCAPVMHCGHGGCAYHDSTPRWRCSCTPW